MKSLILSLSLIISLSIHAEVPELIVIAKQNQFFPGMLLPKAFKCPSPWKTNIEKADSINCNFEKNNLTIDFLKSTREVLQVKAQISRLCKNEKLNELKRSATPCSLIAQKAADVGQEMVYSINCDDFTFGELTCKPTRIDFNVGYSEDHRQLLKNSENLAADSGVSIDGKTYLKALITPKVQFANAVNACERLYKATAVAIIKKSHVTGVNGQNLQYSADSKTLSSEFFCRKTLLASQKKVGCPQGMKLKDSECITDHQNLSELCPVGSQLTIGGGQKISVDKDSVSTEIAELKKECSVAKCYPSSVDNTKNCVTCPIGTSFNPSLKAEASDFVCLKNR